MPHRPEILANLGRADEALEAARILLEAGHFDSAASRAYYAAFYGASAALLAKGVRFGTHSTVITGIHQHFIKARVLETAFGKTLKWLFEIRSIGDYGETQHIPQQEAEKALALAREFVERMKVLSQGDRPGADERE